MNLFKNLSINGKIKEYKKSRECENRYLYKKYCEDYRRSSLIFKMDDELEKIQYVPLFSSSDEAKALFKNYILIKNNIKKIMNDFLGIENEDEQTILNRDRDF